MKLFLFQDRSFLKFRKPTPVTIPDKGSHYLKKSPSPTGHKSPPGVEGGGGEGVTLSPVNEYLQRKALITTTQQVRDKYRSKHKQLNGLMDAWTKAGQIIGKINQKII